MPCSTAFSDPSPARAKSPTSAAQRLKRSVLDSVVHQYKSYTGSNSPLGLRRGPAWPITWSESASTNSAPGMNERPAAPNQPPPSKLVHAGAADPGGEGIDITLADLTAEWRLMADLYALAIQTDRVRFGSITFLAAGERIRLKGEYDYDGRTIFEFDDGGHARRRVRVRAATSGGMSSTSRTKMSALRPCPHENAGGLVLLTAIGQPGIRRVQRQDHPREFADHDLDGIGRRPA